MIATLLLAASAILPADSFVKGENGVWSCDLSGIGISVTPGEYHSGGWTNVPRHPSLYFGSAPMTLAREPEEGSWFTFEGEDNVTVTGLPDSGYSLAGYWTHDWAFEILRVASVSNGVARFKDKHVFGIGKTSWGQKKRRFYAVGHRSFLDTEGEWLVEGSTLFFIPPGGDIASNSVTIAWGDEPVLLLEHRRGEVVRGKTIAFGGGAGLVLRDCRDVLVADCTIECVAGDGIDIAGDCEGVVISNCVIRNVGRRGVALNGGNRRTLAKGGNRVVGCDISRFALLQRVYAPGVTMHGCGNEVVGCRIHDAPHSAIIYGGNEHLIEGNDIFDVVKETGDAGALYTGRDWTSQGNKVVGNRIHDLGRTISNGKSRDVFTMGVYLDDCDCGDTVASNVFERAGCAVMLGGGRENVVVGNKMVDCDIAIHLDDRGVTWTQHWNNPDDPSWNLVKKADDLGYRSEQWAGRYPKLAKIMDDEPRLPKYNVFDGNEVVRCRIPYQFDTFAATWAHASTFRSEATGLFLGAGEDDTEDCAIIAGLALSALVDKYDAERAKGVARALLSLGTKIPGYVCRGVSRDGATVNRGSSRDQITHFVHGLYRYYESGMASREEKDVIRGAFAALADRMIANVTEANGWNALDADGKQDAKGVLKMWNVRPHEAARLPMVYAAAWKTTGDERYREAYEKFVDEAIEQSWGVSKLSEQERKWQMPGYSFLQMNASLEVIRLADSSRASKAEAVMKEVALLAARRFVEEKGADGPWLSAAGDLACAVAMVAKIESIAKILGPELNEKWEKLADDCIFGLNGQPPLWESHPDRIFSLLSVKFRLGK